MNRINFILPPSLQSVLFLSPDAREVMMTNYKALVIDAIENLEPQNERL